MKFFSSLVLALITQSLVGQTSIFMNKDNIALSGYDVVTYHNAHEAVRGNNDYAETANGATYYFSNAANQKAFKANPSAYLPAYGGHCAFAMAMQGAKVPSDPTTFKIRDGRLYLFYNDYYEGKPFNTIIPWNQQERELVNKADTNWTKQ